MVQKVNADGRDIYVCEKCGFKYPAVNMAKACEEACVTKGICRSDIATQAIQDRDKNQGEQT